MCNQYTATNNAEVAKYFRGEVNTTKYNPKVGPLGRAPIIIAPGLVRMAQWGMIPRGSPSSVPTLSNGKRMSTNNARRESLATSWTFRDAWLKGRRCLIPADDYVEPYWGTGKNIWWSIMRADGTPWALAGIWSEWVDPRTGEVVPNFSMITQNCDGHPLLSKFHKPEKGLPPDAPQDKRATVPISPNDWLTWLTGTVEEAEALIQVPPVDMYDHRAVNPLQNLDIFDPVAVAAASAAGPQATLAF